MMKRPPLASKKNAAGNTLLGLFIGLVVGMLFSAAIVWYLSNTPVPFSGKARSLARQDTAIPPVPLILPGKPGDPIPEPSPDKPRFSFYTALPGSTDSLPDPSRPTDIGNDARASNPGGALAAPLYLQTGSFPTAHDADAQKARLAMLGIEASIQQVTVQDKAWFRVRVGPFQAADDMATARSTLAKQGIQVSVVR